MQVVFEEQKKIGGLFPQVYLTRVIRAGGSTIGALRSRLLSLDDLSANARQFWMAVFVLLILFVQGIPAPCIAQAPAQASEARAAEAQAAQEYGELRYRRYYELFGEAEAYFSRRTLRRERMFATLSGFFGLLALGLTVFAVVVLAWGLHVQMPVFRGL